jgi:hypothetical protein
MGTKETAEQLLITDPTGGTGEVSGPELMRKQMEKFSAPSANTVEIKPLDTVVMNAEKSAEESRTTTLTKKRKATSSLESSDTIEKRYSVEISINLKKEDIESIVSGIPNEKIMYVILSSIRQHCVSKYYSFKG